MKLVLCKWPIDNCVSFVKLASTGPRGHPLHANLRLDGEPPTTTSTLPHWWGVDSTRLADPV